MEKLMSEAHKRNINPKYKKSYKNENRDWSQYDRSLRNRGDITIWFSQEAIKAWTPKPKGNPGRQRIYSELAIETVLTLRLLFHLPLRQAEGFVNSIIALMGLELSTPDHTTLSRRSKTLKPLLNARINPGEPLHVVVDSTGLSIHGEGPWSRHKHGGKRRRGWRKLHITVDQNGQILSTSLTDETTKDASEIPRLLIDIDGPICSFTADGAYDEQPVYQAVLDHSKDASIVIPPRTNAVGSATGGDEWIQRDNHIHKIRRDGIYSWRRESGYYRQSTGENGFYRYQAIIGRKLRARDENARLVEVILGCKILNRCLDLGRSESVRVK
tara:strand:- start:57 stop:1040 length:984 start_codon:yes stop_codon:yes gene_type:complete